MLELLEPRQLLSADVLESSLVVDQPVLSMPALSVDAGKLERFAADDMLLIRTDGEDGSWSLSPCGENEQRDKDRRVLVRREQGSFEIEILRLFRVSGTWCNEKWEKAPTTQPTTQPSTERWRDLAE